MWKSRENTIQFEQTASTTHQDNIQQEIQLEEQTIAKLKRQKQKIIEMASKYRSMEIDLRQKKQEVKGLKNQLRKAKERIVNLETGLKFQETQRTYVNAELKKQNNFLLDKLRRFEIEIACKNEQIQAISAYEGEYKEKNKVLQKQLQDKRMSLNQSQEQVKKLGGLVERQAKLLQKQDEQFNLLVAENEELHRKISQKPDEEYHREKTAEHILQMNEHFRQLARKLSKHNEDWQVLMELERLRVMMRDLAKGEVEKIQTLVNNF